MYWNEKTTKEVIDLNGHCGGPSSDVTGGLLTRDEELCGSVPSTESISGTQTHP